MGKNGKKYKEDLKKLDRTQRYKVDDAIKLLKQTQKKKFDESIDVSINLGINPKLSDQMVRGTCALPNGTGKKIKILAFAKGDKEKEAKEAGADYVGSEEFIEKIKKGWLDFDKTVATPDLMKDIGKIGKILGTKGLMPNPKLGTVTNEIGKAISELKAGKIDFRADKAGLVHTIIGKISFSDEKLKENFLSLMGTILKLKPASSKGTYLRGVTISSTMGVGIKLDVSDIRSFFK